MDRIRIDSLDELKRLSTNNSLECYVGVNVISRKTIIYHEKEKEFVIQNHIDDTVTCVLAEDIYDTRITLVGEAILNNCLFYDPEDNLDLIEENENRPSAEEQAEYDKHLAEDIQRQMEEDNFYNNNPHKG